MKRVLSLLLVALMLISFMPFSSVVHAAEGDRLTLDVSDVACNIGEQVTVTISAKDNQGFGGLAFFVEFNEEELQLVSYSLAEIDLAGGSAQGPQKNKYQSPAKFIYVSGTDNITESGVLAQLVFEVVAAEPCESEIKVTPSDNGDNFYYDENFNEYDYTVAEVTAVVSVTCTHEAKTEVPAKSADCENDGNYLYYVCDSCGAVLMADGVTETTVEAETIAPLGHDYGDASCTEAATCTRCGETTGEALGHSFTNYVSNEDAACTADGTKTAKCDNCDEIDTVTDEGSALGHDYGVATLLRRRLALAAVKLPARHWVIALRTMNPMATRPAPRTAPRPPSATAAP